MSNAIQATENRFGRLLLVILMTSVGFSLLVGCGKNKGQVVGNPPPKCEKDCDEDTKPFSGEPWLTAIGTGYGFEIGIDFYDAGGKNSSAQGIEVTPAPAKMNADGTLWMDNGNACWIAGGEYNFTKAKKVGTVNVRQIPLYGYWYYPDFYQYQDGYSYYMIEGWEFEAVSKSGDKITVSLGGMGQYGYGAVTAYQNSYPKKGRDGLNYDFSMYGPLIVNGCHL